MRIKGVKMGNLETILRRLYEYMGFSKDLDFCEKYDIKPNTLSTWKKRNKIPYELLENISQNENLSMDWLLSGEGHPEKKTALNMPFKAVVTPFKAVMGKKAMSELEQRLISEVVANSYIVTKLSLEASAGDGIENFQVEESEVFLDKALFRHSVNQNNLRMIPVKGDSMEPNILDESHIIIDVSQKENIDGIYAINLGGNIMVKRLQFNLDGNIEIISDNTKYQTKTYNPKESQIHFEILGKKILSIQ